MKFLAVFSLCVVVILATPLKNPQDGRFWKGDTAKNGQFPYQVAIFVTYKDGSTASGSGALISTTAVLTTAELINKADSITVQVGSVHLLGNDPSQVLFGTNDYVVHPDYDANKYENDLGIVHLKSPVELNEYVSTIPLSGSHLADDTEVTIAGWGKTENSHGSGVLDLHYGSQSIITNERCTHYFGYFSSIVTDNKACASIPIGAPTAGVCEGDLGAPVVDENGNLVAVVIFAYSSACGSGPSGLVRVLPYVDWIRANL